MNQYALIEYKDLGGGIREDTINTPSAMPDNALAKIHNFEYQDDGSLQSRNGTSPYNALPISSGTAIDNGVRYARNTSATNALVVSLAHPTNNKVYLGNDTLGTFTEITSGTAFTANKPINFLVARDTLFMANESSKINYYTSGTTRQEIVSTDNYRAGKYLAWCDNILWQAGDPTYPNRVWASADGLFITSPGVDCSFPANYFVDMPKAENDYITGLIASENELLIYRQGDISLMLGTFLDWSLQRIEQVGAIDQRAIVAAKEFGLFFVGKNSIYWKPNLNTTAVDIGKFIGTTFRDNYFGASRGGYYSRNKFVYFSYSTASTAANSLCCVWDCIGERWVTNDIPADGFVDFDGITDTQNFYAISPTAGTVNRVDTGNDDNGANFTAQLWTKHYDMRAAQFNKLGRMFLVGCEAQTGTAPFTVAVNMNRGRKLADFRAVSVTGFMYWGQLVFGKDTYGGGGYNVAKLPFPHGSKAREFQIKFTKTNAYPLKIYNMAFEYMKDTYRRAAD